MLARQHWGKQIDFLDLNDDDIQYLQRKEYHSELVKKIPFKILLRKLEDNTIRIEVNDRLTGKWGSFAVSETNNLEGLDKISADLEKGKFAFKPSLDEFLDTLKKAIFGN
jgi:hypothetical protein